MFSSTQIFCQRSYILHQFRIRICS